MPKGGKGLKVKTEERYRQISVFMPAALEERIKDRAAEEQRSVSSFVRLAVLRELDAEGAHRGR